MPNDQHRHRYSVQNYKATRFQPWTTVLRIWTDLQDEESAERWMIKKRHSDESLKIKTKPKKLDTSPEHKHSGVVSVKLKNLQQ